MNREIGIVSPASYVISSWTAEENKVFEYALALFDRDTPERWHNVAAMIPGKTVNDVVKQYRQLEEDVAHIEAGTFIPVPRYSNDSVTFEWMSPRRFENLYRPSRNDHQRKKGVPWTEEEHRQFLFGLKQHGKGDWSNISRNFVKTRTPTQVASHAQKYYIRQLSGGKDKKRPSIHDMTIVDLDQTMKSAASVSQQQQRGLDEDVVVGATYDSEPPMIQGTCSEHFPPFQSDNDPHGPLLGHHGSVYPMDELDILEFIDPLSVDSSICFTN